MATKVFDLFGNVSLRDEDARKKLDEIRKKADQVSKKLDEVGRRLANFGRTLTTHVSLPIVGLGALLVKLSSDAEETRAKFETAFRDVREEADRTADNLAENYGLSHTAAERLLSSTGDLLKGFGATGEQALDLSGRVQELAADLASYNNVQGGTEAASQAITAALLGEREQIKQLGIVIREEDVQQQMMLNGQENLTGQARLLAQAQATLQLAYEQSGDALGDAIDTQDSAANQLRRLRGDVEDLGTSFKDIVLPMAKDAITRLRSFVQWLTNLDDATKRNIVRIALIVAAIGPMILIIGKAITAFAAIRKAVIAVNIAMAANPVLALATGISALAGILGGVFISRARAARREQDELRDSMNETEEAARRLERTLTGGEELFRSLMLNPYQTAEQVLERITSEASSWADAVEILEAHISELQETVAFQTRRIESGPVDPRVIRTVELATEMIAVMRARVAELRREFGRGEENERFNELLEEFNNEMELAAQRAEVFGDEFDLASEQLKLYEDLIKDAIEAGISFNNQSFDRVIAEWRALKDEAQETVRTLAASEIEAEAAQRLRDQTATRIQQLQRQRDEEIRLAEEAGARTADIERYYANEIAELRREIESSALTRLFEQTATRIEVLEQQRDEEIRVARETGAETVAIEMYYANLIAEEERRSEEERQRLDEEREAEAQAARDAIVAEARAAIQVGQEQQRIEEQHAATRRQFYIEQLDAEQQFLVRLEERAKELREAGVAEIDIEQWKQDELKKYRDKAAREEEDRQKELRKATIDGWITIMQAIADVLDEFAAIRIAQLETLAERELEIAQDKREHLTEEELAYQAFLEEQEAARYANMTEEEKREYDLRKEAEESRRKLEEETAAEEERIARELAIKKAQIERKQAIQRQIIGAFEIGIDTARAIVGFLVNPGGPWGIALSIAAGLTGAAELIALWAQKLPALPTFAAGGIVPGTKYTGDQVPARVNSGEMILTRKMQENLLNLIASRQPNRFANGADFVVPPGYPNDSYPFYAQSGERVTVTPSQRSSEFPRRAILQVGDREMQAWLYERMEDGHLRVPRRALEE